MEAEQRLKKKLLASGLEPDGFNIPLRNLRAEAELFRDQNLPLLAEEIKLSNEHDKIVGAQTVEWEGREITVTQLESFFRDPDRSLRERAWQLGAQRWLTDREAINQLWQRFLSLRQKIANNATQGDYRAYRWQQLKRFDYTPEDCVLFHQAIEETMTPAARRIYERRRQRMGLKALRPWDLDVDPLGRPPMQPFKDVAELETKSAAIFQNVHPQLGKHFDTMIQEGLLDLENRKHKAPGGYCTSFNRIRRPFIFINAVGIHDDVQTLLHEAGHAFHVFESAHLPYFPQRTVPLEFAEVASMGMELLALPFLESNLGGFYNPADTARASIEELESNILFWPYMAVVDAFQHWVYENPDQASDPSQCDTHWAELWTRFMPEIDWSGLEDVLVTGWHRKDHIHCVPLYYVEYGLAQLGAVQLWCNALQDQDKAIARYRQALSLGGTVPLPQLFQTAGARLAFDAGTLHEAAKFIENMIAELEEDLE